MNRLTKWILIVSLSVNIALLLGIAISFFTYSHYFYRRPHSHHELFLAPFRMHKIYPQKRFEKHQRASKKEFFRELYRNHPHLLVLFFEIRELQGEFMAHLGENSFDRRAAEATLQQLQQQLQKGYEEFYPLLLDWVQKLSPKQRRKYLRQFLPPEEWERDEEEDE